MTRVNLVPNDVVIGEAVTRLAVARGTLIDEVASEVYIDGLEDLDAQLVRRACHALGLEPRGEFEPALPPVAIIRARAVQIGREDDQAAAAARLLPAPVKADDREPTFFCRDCFDEPNGWQLLVCRGVEATAELNAGRITGLVTRPCGRRGPHAAHTYAEKCACIATNPVIARHRQRMDDARRRAS